MNDLQYIYKQMEKEISEDIFLSGDISRNLIIIRNENKDPNISRKAQIEINCFDFYLNDGKLDPLYKFISPDGTEVKIPDLNFFSEDDYNYIQKRAEETSNKYLKSRYYMILVEGKRDHISAQKLININLSILNEMKEDLEEEKLIIFLNYLINTYVVATSFNFKEKEEIKSFILEIIQNKSYNNSQHYIIKTRLIELILNEKKNFEEIDYNDLNLNLMELLKDLENKKMYSHIINLSELGIKIENKLKTNNFKWKLNIAKTYETMALEHDNRLAKQQLLLKSIKKYKEIKDLNKVNELTSIFDELKGTIKLNEISIKIEEFSEISVELDYLANEISNENHYIILNELMNNYNCLVGRYNNFEELVKNINQKHRLSFDFPKIVYDRRGNILKEYKTLNERKEFALNSNYSLFISAICSYYLNNLIILSIMKGNLNARNLLEFIENETWIGYKIEDKLAFSHLFYLVPIINNYFFEMNQYLKHPDYAPHFVLTMNSLILRIEGIVRDMCKNLDISTTYIKNGVTEEKNLNLLLKEEKLEELIGKDDLFFLKYILIDKGGINLRNEIAHSLASPQKYNLNNVNLLLLALLRIIKYELK